MSIIGAPRNPVQQELPPWSVFRTDTNGRRYIRADARGGPPACITHSELFAHGETASVMCSALVRSTMLFGNAAYEGIGVAVQAYVRDASASSGLRLIWQQRPDLAGDPELWVTRTFADWTPIDFVVQMPESVSPDFIRVSWVTKGYSGQTDITGFVVRDFYSRTFVTEVPDPGDNGSNYEFNDEYSSSFSTSGNGGNQSALSTRIFTHYFTTHVARIKSGQPIDLFINIDLQYAQIEELPGGPITPRVEVAGYIGLKCVRREDGGSDWIYAQLNSGTAASFYLSGVLSASIRKPAANAYQQIEPAAILRAPTMVGTSDARTKFDHRGITMKITVDDSVESGVG